MSATGTSVTGSPATSVMVQPTYVYTANMPPKPTVATTRVSHTCPRRRADSSVRGSVVRTSCRSGTRSAIAATVSAPIRATTANALRQPSPCPIQVAAGTPATLATARPLMTIATAFARCPGPARYAATSDATPK